MTPFSRQPHALPRAGTIPKRGSWGTHGDSWGNPSPSQKTDPQHITPPNTVHGGKSKFIPIPLFRKARRPDRRVGLSGAKTAPSSPPLSSPDNPPFPVAPPPSQAATNHPCPLSTRPRPLHQKASFILAALLWTLLAPSVHATVRLPALFSDHMVLQKDVPVPVWGWAAPQEQITVAIAGQTKSTVTGPDGRWRLTLDPLPAGNIQELTVQGGNSLTIKDVWIGEVWLCAGQSNMVMTVAQSKDAAQEIATSDLPQIRMFTVQSGKAASAQEDCAGQWVVCSPRTVADFSAVGFYFGREIQRRIGGAVGLVNASAGGTLIESWLDLEAQQACAELKPFFVQRDRMMAQFDQTGAEAQHQSALLKWEAAVAQARAGNLPPPQKPTHPADSFMGIMDVGGLFNGKIAPLIPFPLRGIVWYQGESNAHPDRARFYETQMRLLVQDWRARWGSVLPFAWVQLPNLAKKMPWPEIREAQLRTLSLPGTGMAVTLDVGESKDIHPKNKQAVGQRLALWALGDVYGQKVPATSGPLPAGHEVHGREIVLHFHHADGGLAAKDGPLKGFVIAGENREWQSADARIEGASVTVSSPQISQPVAVRYAWASDPVFNLYNGAGLPASPFRTDDWDTLTPP